MVEQTAFSLSVCVLTASGCFSLLAVVNVPAINTEIRLSMWPYFQLFWEWGSVSCVIPCLVCSGAHILFFRVCRVLHGPQQWTKALIFPSFCQRLVFCIIVTNIAMMMGMRWCLISSDLCFLRLMTVSGFSWAYCLFAVSLKKTILSVLISLSFLLVVEILYLYFGYQITIKEICTCFLPLYLGPLFSLLIMSFYIQMCFILRNPMSLLFLVYSCFWYLICESRGTPRSWKTSPCFLVRGLGLDF